MNKVEKCKKELAKALYCGDRYGDSCDCDCKACLEDTLDALSDFEVLVRADERTKTLDECKKLIDSILEYYQNEYFRGSTFYGMRENIIGQIEKLKNTRLDM